MRPYENDEVLDNMDEYASFAADKEKPATDYYQEGRKPVDTLPAAWWNYFIGMLTKNENRAALSLDDIYAELQNFLAASNMVPDASKTDQLKSMLKTEATALSIAFRDGEGKLRVIAGTETNHAVNKQQLDDKITTDVNSEAVDKSLAMSVLNPWMGDRRLKTYTGLPDTVDFTTDTMQTIFDALPKYSQTIFDFSFTEYPSDVPERRGSMVIIRYNVMGTFKLNGGSDSYERAVTYGDIEDDWRQIADITTDIDNTEGGKALAMSVLSPWMGDRRLKTYTGIHQYSQNTQPSSAEELAQDLPDYSMLVLDTYLLLPSWESWKPPQVTNYGTITVTRLWERRIEYTYSCDSGFFESYGAFDPTTDVFTWSGWKEVTTYNTDGSIDLGDTSISEEWMNDRKVRTYYDLTDSGVTDTSTPIKIAEQLKNNSVLYLNTSLLSDKTWLPTDMPTEYNQLRITKTENARCRFEIWDVFDGASYFYGNVVRINFPDVRWSGWKFSSTYSTNGKATNSDGGEVVDDDLISADTTWSSEEIEAKLRAYGYGTRCRNVTEDWNEATVNGWWMGQGKSNAPTNQSDWWYGFTITHTALWVTQILFPFTSYNPKMWVRSSYDESGVRKWREWNQVSYIDDIDLEATNTVLSASKTLELNGYTPTYVVDSQAKFTDWVNNISGNDYTHVYVASGTYTSTKTLNLTTTGTKTVQGCTSDRPKLEFTSCNEAVKYNTAPTTDDYFIHDIIVECTYMNGDCRGFTKCTNLTRCKGMGHGSGEGYLNGTGFYLCTNLINCNGEGEGANTGYGFYLCTNLINCNGNGVATGAGTSSSLGYGFYECTDLTNCDGDGNGANRGYGFGECTNLTTCKGIGRGASYGHGFQQCNNLFMCAGTGIGDANNGQGFKYCTGVSYCKKGATSTTTTFDTTSCSANQGTYNATYKVANTANGGFNDLT